MSSITTGNRQAHWLAATVTTVAMCAVRPVLEPGG
ncbi:hypothetical protein JOM49_004332 [Amycolatopsis magusensis]|uniref:Uncharacterized protein n=1 Tax=Amycolatopsis magusensis TaxID=882444 RepID=A0ABS4PTP9_9PSEU|nr:hypothetical protein [Amycolatopsis magusensis]